MKYHYTYRITNTVEKKYYYGVHSCDCLPKEDIGVKYFSSSKNKVFKQDIKDNPKNYKYKVIKIFSTRKEAVQHEIYLHKKFNVGVNKSFYNGSKQTSTGFDTSGISYKNIFSLINGNTKQIELNVDIPEGYILGRHWGNTKNKTVQKKTKLNKTIGWSLIEQTENIND